MCFCRVQPTMHIPVAKECSRVHTTLNMVCLITRLFLLPVFDWSLAVSKIWGGRPKRFGHIGWTEGGHTGVCAWWRIVKPFLVLSVRGLEARSQQDTIRITICCLRWQGRVCLPSCLPDQPCHVLIASLEEHETVTSEWHIVSNQVSSLSLPFCSVNYHRRSRVGKTYLFISASLELAQALTNTNANR